MRPVLLIFALAAAFLGVAKLCADDATRQVQEELRKRNLFYGDIDGRQTSSLTAALKQYQERKGFPATGEIDADTLRSMGISETGDGEQLPNVPVLRSDRGVGEGRDATDGLSSVANPAPPADAPPPSRDEMQAFIRAYLNACETPAVTDELSFYAGRVEYFDHGMVTRTYIRNELVAYGQQWPERQYTMGKALTTSKRGLDLVVRCRIKFNLANGQQNRRASGETENDFTLARRKDMRLEIVGHREERIRRQVSNTRRRSRRQQADPVRRVQRTLRKFFR